MIDLRSELVEAVKSAVSEIEAAVRRVLLAELPRLLRGDPEELLDAERAARLLGMSPGALRRAAERGTLPVQPVRLGRRLRWRRGDLLALVPAASPTRPPIRRAAPKGVD